MTDTAQVERKVNECKPLPGGRVVGVEPQNLVVVLGRGLHSSTFRLNVSAF